jgi:hypothetical protein
MASNRIAQTAAVMILSALCFTATPAVAVDTTMSSSTEWQQQIQSKLQPPTVDRPKIQLPANSNLNAISKTNDRLQALISLANPQKNRPFGSDFLVLQVWDSEEHALLLGGAKIPVAMIRSFPTMVQLGPQNSKVSMEDWNQLVPSLEDLWIEASICPEESSSLPCPSSEQRLASKGVSKLLRQLPGLDEGTTTAGIRVPATLPLSSVVQQ